jgi:hypothetical protein
MKILFFILAGALARACAKSADNVGAGAAKSIDNVAIGYESAIAKATAKAVLYREREFSSDENISYDETTGIITIDNTKAGLAFIL